MASVDIVQDPCLNNYSIIIIVKDDAAVGAILANNYLHCQPHIQISTLHVAST